VSETDDSSGAKPVGKVSVSVLIIAGPT